MKEYLKHLLDRFEGCSLRERILISVTLFTFTGGLWFTLLGGVVVDKKVVVVKSIDRLTRDMQAQTAEQIRLLAEDKTPAKIALQHRQDQLQAVIVEQQAELDELLDRFIAPEQVPDLLEDVLDGFADLQLVRLASRPSEPVVLQAASHGADAGENADAITPPQVTIYRHPVEIEFVGGYMDVLAYLNALEAAEWQFSWRRFDYVVEEYPNAQVRIELETLSREKEWLGV
jgi:MSHA biogenesis protein MshJ